MIATSQALRLKVTTIQVAVCGAAPYSRQLALQIKDTFNIGKFVVSIKVTCTF
jgi:hypothetical protein